MGQARQTTSEMGISRAWPTAREIGISQADLKISRAGPGAVRSARRGPTCESWPHSQRPLELKYGYFFNFENITKRDIKRDVSAIFVRNGMS